MESNIAEPEVLGVERNLAEPHFDDEATLLSARPVVPLKKVVAKAPLTRTWVFGLALAGALLVGVAATAFYYSRLNHTESKPTTEIESVTDEGVSADVPAPTRSMGADSHSEADGPGPAESSNQTAEEEDFLTKPVKAQPRTGANVAVRSSNDVAEVAGSEAENGRQRRTARREARARKRLARRERHNKNSGDDLLRIREIFEGPPKF